MSSLASDTSLLKATDYRLKRKSFSHRVCARCDLGIEETIRHLVMQCPFYSDMCAELFGALSRLNSEAAGIVVNDPPSYFHVIMGRHPENADFQEMNDYSIVVDPQSPYEFLPVSFVLLF